MAKMKDGTRAVFEYIRAHDGEDFSAKDIAQALNMDVRAVNGSITSFCRDTKGWCEREEVSITGGTVKYIRLTDIGREVDLDAE